MTTKNLKIAEGKRTYITKPNAEDMPDFLKAVEQSQSLHFPWVNPPSNKDQYTLYLKRVDLPSHEGFFIKCRDTNQLVGVVNINEIVRGALQSGYLGYYAFANHAEQGLMTEGFALVASYAINEMNLHRLEANIQPDNGKSIAFIKKQGFRLEGFSPNYLMINGKWEDHARFAITAEVL